MKRKEKNIKNVIIYQAKSGAIELKGDFGKETIWASKKPLSSVLEPLFNQARTYFSKN